MIQLIFIRHGATAGNLEKRYIGSTDEPLCDIGIAQVESLRKHNFQADFLYVSPMLRTRQTAELLFPKMDYTFVSDFRETNFGLFEGKTAEEIVEILNVEKKNIRLIALLDTLEYLKKGGRISKTVAFAGGVLNIKPVLSVIDGEISMLGIQLCRSCNFTY